MPTLLLAWLLPLTAVARPAALVDTALASQGRFAAWLRDNGFARVGPGTPQLGWVLADGGTHVTFQTGGPHGPTTRRGCLDSTPQPVPLRPLPQAAAAGSPLPGRPGHRIVDLRERSVSLQALSVTDACRTWFLDADQRVRAPDAFRLVHSVLEARLEESVCRERKAGRKEPVCKTVDHGWVTVAHKDLPLLTAFGGWTVFETDPAVARLSSDCSNGDGAACLSLGDRYRTGDGVPRSRSHAADLHQQSCDQGFLEGCTVLATRRATGDGVPKDLSGAASLAEQACTRLAHCHCDGYGVPKNPERAAALFKAACEQSSLECGWQSSCR